MSTNKPTAYLAFDLGAESGRAMLAELSGGRVVLHEAHRFANTPQQLPSGYHWNLTELWRNLQVGLQQGHKLAAEKGLGLVSLGVDTWGVDVGLIGRSGQLLGLPYAYRDASHAQAFDRVIEQLGREKIYDRTGIQFMPLNTLYQLVARRDSEPVLLDAAKRMLFTPDLLHYFFSGQQVNEATIASTSQMVDPRTGQWATDLLDELGLPTGMLGEIVPAGTVIGKVTQQVAEALQVPEIDVTVPGAHDTASAVAAVPVDTDQHGDRWAYLSSGTWSLMGAELDEPVVNDAAYEANYTNERGVGDKIRFLKNIAGLWLVQEVRRDYDKQGRGFDYAELTDLAEQAEPFRTLVDPAHEPFAAPGDMLEKITAFAKDTGQPVPETPGQFVRCCLESLALTYRETLHTLGELTGRSFDVLHIVGGGGQNQLLNQLTADAIERPVIVGPFEATAVGNALTQAVGRGDLADLAALREVVRNSFELSTCEPGPGSAALAKQADRFAQITGG